jgi:membrane protease YdiL (CAAX protease family)
MGVQFRLATSLITEATALAVLCYVMNRQGTTWKDIGLRLALADVPRALVLFIAAKIASYVLWFPIQYGYRAYSGHFLAATYVSPLHGIGISALSIAFVCLNPFFEELIVRAYTISEVINLGGSRTLAVILSVVCQISYHLYQGAANVLVHTILFTAYSIYYVRARRIGPVILIHLYVDFSALIRAAH